MTTQNLGHAKQWFSFKFSKSRPPYDFQYQITSRNRESTVLEKAPHNPKIDGGLA